MCIVTPLMNDQYVWCFQGFVSFSLWHLCLNVCCNWAILCVQRTFCIACIYYYLMPYLCVLILVRQTSVTKHSHFGVNDLDRFWNAHPGNPELQSISLPARLWICYQDELRKQLIIFDKGQYEKQRNTLHVAILTFIHTNHLQAISFSMTTSWPMSSSRVGWAPLLCVCVCVCVCYSCSGPRLLNARTSCANMDPLPVLSFTIPPLSSIHLFLLSMTCSLSAPAIPLSHSLTVSPLCSSANRDMGRPHP